MGIRLHYHPRRRYRCHGFHFRRMGMHRMYLHDHHHLNLGTLIQGMLSYHTLGGNYQDRFQEGCRRIRLHRYHSTELNPKGNCPGYFH